MTEQSYVNRPRGIAAIVMAALGLVGLSPPLPVDYPPPVMPRRRARRKTTHFAANGQTECERRQRQMARGAKLDAVAETIHGPGRPIERIRPVYAMPFPHAGASLRKANLG